MHYDHLQHVGTQEFKDVHLEFLRLVDGPWADQAAAEDAVLEDAWELLDPDGDWDLSEPQVRAAIRTGQAPGQEDPAALVRLAGPDLRALDTPDAI